MTSLTDTDLVRKSCEEALKSDESWKAFRQLPGFKFAIDNFPESSYQALIESIPEEDITINIVRADVGGAKQIAGRRGRLLSPAMWRYLAISRDLRRRFDLLGAYVVEIGCGFGAQIMALKKQHRIGEVLLFDTAPMLKVAFKYLRQFQVHVSAFDTGHIPELPFLKDANALCISNYALSEMRRDWQELYIKNVIRHCPRGFILWNFPRKDFDSMTAVEFVEKLDRPCKMDKDVVEIDPSVVKITWGDH